MVAAFAIAVFFVVLWVFAEFRAQRSIRLVLGIAAIGCSVGLAALVSFLERTDLADHYRAANNNLAYAVEAAIKHGHSDRVVSVLRPLREQSNYDVATPVDYYRVIQSAADQINLSDNAGR